MRKRIERKPVEALAIANLATSIAETLPTNAYPPALPPAKSPLLSSSVP